MRITKYGHCCLFVEESGLKLLTDPGMYSTRQDSVLGIHAVLLTHDHSDHLHVDSLKTVLKNNPKAKVITNTGTAPTLSKVDIPCVILDDGQKTTEEGVLIEAFGSEHAPIYPTLPPMPNTGFFIANRLFYPGDAFTDPKKPIEILALPVAGPWMKLMEGIDYALKLKPKVCFPVHDGILKSIGSTNALPPKILEPLGIKFIPLEIDKPQEF
jgi:L-ascorbate metabolism protein UlaG (beta-lactamase superfamily)